MLTRIRSTNFAGRVHFYASAQVCLCTGIFVAQVCLCKGMLMDRFEYTKVSNGRRRPIGRKVEVGGGGCEGIIIRIR